MAAISTLQLGYSNLGSFSSIGTPVAQSVSAGVMSTTVRASGSAPGDGIRSTDAVDWRSSSVTWELASVGGSQPLVRVSGHGVNNSPAVIHLQNGSMYYGYTDANGEFNGILSTRTGNFRFGRMTMDSGSGVTFELSNDGTTWSESYFTTGFGDFSNLKFQIYGDPTSGSPTWVLNRVNTAPSPPGPSTLFRPYFITG